MTLPSGKGAMVWKLRDWVGGDPSLQAKQAKDLGLGWVSLKIVDRTDLRWEGNTPRQNADLLPDTIAALEEAGVQPTAWGYTYGARWVLNNGNWVLGYSEAAAAAEAAAACDALALYGLTHFDIDAEAEYQSAGADKRATAYGTALAQHGPEYSQSLCSYRFPLTNQPKFPVRQFAPFVEVWAPQVYFLLDNRANGGAIQLETSFNQHQSVRALPFMPMAPTYAYGSWRASGQQLTSFFQKAKDLGCIGFGVYELTMASEDQLAAIRGFAWEPIIPPSPPPADKIAVEVRVPAGRASVTVTET
jgi:hypothetical protein